FCAVPFPRVAVAVNRDVAPIAGADPLTVSAETVPPALLVDVEEGAAGPDGDPLKRTTLSDASTTTLRRDRDVTVRTYGLWLACPHGGTAKDRRTDASARVSECTGLALSQRQRQGPLFDGRLV